MTDSITTTAPTPNHILSMASGRTPGEIKDDSATLRRAAFILSRAGVSRCDYINADLHNFAAGLDLWSHKVRNGVAE